MAQVAPEHARTVQIRNGTETDLGSKEVRTLKRGDIVSFRLAGAGGILRRAC
jgi:hypothetical protein